MSDGMESTYPSRIGSTIRTSSNCERKKNMARKFEELRAKMSPEARASAEARAQVMLKEFALDELRAARNLTQEHLAEVLNVGQAAISKMERRSDMYISTLSHFVRSLGGRLEIRADLPHGEVRISQFKELG